MCSIGLNTRVKDKRNLIANIVNEWDKNNVPYTSNDDIEKCKIFGICNSKTDFITHTKLTGIGDHYYPLCKHIKTKKTVGSDSLWNRIPVSGSNTTYKEDKTNMDKVKKWLEYAESKGAKLYYNLSDEFVELLNKNINKLIKINELAFKELKELR